MVELVLLFLFWSSLLLHCFYSARQRVLLVGRVNFSSSEILSLAKKKLQDVNANIVGIVLNDIPLSGYQYYDSAYYADDTEAKNTNGNDEGRTILHLE